MARPTVAARSGKGNKDFRSRLTGHEIALLAELYANGISAKAVAARFA